MFHAEIRVDLPSELPSPRKPVRSLVQWLLGRVPAPDAGFETLISCGLTVLERTLEALDAAGFDDILSIVVDGRPAYVDVENKLGDLADALEGVVRCGLLREGFGVLRLTASAVCSQSEGSDDVVRVLADVRIRSRVPTGDPEVVIAMSGRVQRLEIQPEELPREYAGRVRAWVRDPGALDSAKAAFDGLTDALSQALARCMDGARATRDPTKVRVIVPGPRQVGRFRYLTFGPTFRGIVYEALPSHERSGAYDDPFYRHLYSSYYDLLSWIVAGEVLDGAWPRSDVELVDPRGATLVTGDRASSLETETLEVERKAVRTNERGELVVDDSIPRVASLDAAERGSPHTPGWAGGNWGEDGGDGDAGGEGGG
jgi:hypothetical protein